MKRFLIAIAALLLLCGVSEANGIRRGGCNTCVSAPYYSAPIVHETITAVPVPVFVPVFQFQYQPSPCVSPAQPVGAYGYPAYGTPAYGAQAVQPGLQQGMQGQPQQQQPSYGANIEKDRLRAFAKALLEEMRELDNQQQGQQQGDNGPPMVVDGFQPNQPRPQVQPQLNWLAVLNNRCATCHTGASAKGRVVIFDGPGQLNPRLTPQDKVAMLNAVKELKMPEGAKTDPNKRLTQAEFNTLQAWVYGQ